MAGLREVIAGIMRPVGAGATAGAPREAPEATSRPIRATPVPGAAPEAPEATPGPALPLGCQCFAGGRAPRGLVLVTRVTSGALVRHQQATAPAKVERGAFLGIDFGGGVGLSRSPTPGRAQDLISYSIKYGPELFAIRKIPNHRVPHATLPLCDSQGLAELHLDVLEPGEGSKSNLRVSDSLRRF